MLHKTFFKHTKICDVKQHRRYVYWLLCRSFELFLSFCKFVPVRGAYSEYPVPVERENELYRKREQEKETKNFWLQSDTDKVEYSMCNLLQTTVDEFCMCQNSPKHLLVKMRVSQVFIMHYSTDQFSFDTCLHATDPKKISCKWQWQWFKCPFYDITNHIRVQQCGIIANQQGVTPVAVKKQYSIALKTENRSPEEEDIPPILLSLVTWIMDGFSFVFVESWS